jgi:hypothetical protein
MVLQQTYVAAFMLQQTHGAVSVAGRLFRRRAVNGSRLAIETAHLSLTL